MLRRDSHKRGVPLYRRAGDPFLVLDLEPTGLVSYMKQFAADEPERFVKLDGGKWKIEPPRPRPTVPTDRSGEGRSLLTSEHCSDC